MAAHYITIRNRKRVQKLIKSKSQGNDPKGRDFIAV